MAISLYSVLEKIYNLLPASCAKIKQDGQTGRVLLLLIRNNTAASQISPSVAFLQPSKMLSIRFLVIPLSNFVLPHKKGKKTLGHEDGRSSRLSFHFSIPTQIGNKISHFKSGFPRPTLQGSDPSEVHISLI